MALNQIPYTNVHELNLDWILARLKDFEARLDAIEDYGAEIDAIKANISSLETSLQTLRTTIASSLTALNARCTALENEDDKIHNSINALYESVAHDIAEITTQFDAINATLVSLRAYNDTSNAEVLSAAKQYTRDKIEEIMRLIYDPKIIYVTNPWTMQIVTIQEFIDYLYGILHFAGLTCNEFDALELTVDEFEALGLTCEEFDNYGKWAIYFSAGYVTNTELQNILLNYATQADIALLATKEELAHYATLNDVKVFNPITGIYGSVQVAINSLAALHQRGLTAEMFDELEMTASEFDALDLTAFEFDFTWIP